MDRIKLQRRPGGFLTAVLSLMLTLHAQGGGSGLNTMVIVNAQSPDSLALGNYYCERRGVPPENVLRISWMGGSIAWSIDDFHARLLAPLSIALAERQISNQIDVVVLSMDIPFQTTNSSSVNSTTAALYYGFKSPGSQNWKGITNSYAFSESAFAKNRPLSANGPSFLTTMITANSLAQARMLIDQGVASDETFPSQKVILAKSSDTLRNLRHQRFDNALFNSQIRGNIRMTKTNSNSASGWSEILGFQTGLAGFSVSPATFVPGALADSMTSFGGVIFGPNGQTSLLAFIHAGASGSYGTVAEPSPDLNKFPDPQVYFFQSRGFNLAESYFQSVAVPYLGLIVGEPLAAPFARSASGRWTGIQSNAVLSGTVSLGLEFSSDDRRPVQQVDLFLNGKYYRTLTNIPPVPGNRLGLTLSGTPLSHTVGAGATLLSIAKDLASLINSEDLTNATGISAAPHGDRIEIRYAGTKSFGKPNPPQNFSRSIQSGLPADSPAPHNAAFALNSTQGTNEMLGTFIHSSRNHLVNSPAHGRRTCNVSGTVQPGAWVRLTVVKTNGAIVSLSTTNQALNAKPFDLAEALVSKINQTISLQEEDGVLAEDLTPGWSGAGSFSLRARSTGLESAAIRISLASSGAAVAPALPVRLDQNLDDLLPRNHLYVTAGATNLAFTFVLNTAAVPDGYHELTAVAYEGSSIRTQTRVSVPIRVRNTLLNSTLTSVDLTNSVSASGTYRLRVVAEGGNVTNAVLFTTGGPWNSVSDRNPAEFTINGSMLGAGLHPFYAVVATSSGEMFRTETRWVRLGP